MHLKTKKRSAYAFPIAICVVIAVSLVLGGVILPAVGEMAVGETAAAGDAVRQALHLLLNWLGVPFLILLSGMCFTTLLSDREAVFRGIVLLLGDFFLIRVVTELFRFCTEKWMAFTVFSDDSAAWLFLAWGGTWDYRTC